MRIKVLYEDKDILAIDKPSGISVHPDGRSKDKTITDWVLENYPKLIGKKHPPRTDEFLKKQFQDREIKKTYLAIVSGWVKNESAIIDNPIGRSPSDFRRRLAGRGARGELRPAVTMYKVIKRFEDENKNKFTYLEISPKTGRTHQIRVHMKYLNHPVACDSLYNPTGACPAGLKRLALHAKSIEFSALGRSASGEKDLKDKTIKVESPLPKDIERVVK